MAITDKKQGVWDTDEVYNKIDQGSIWTYDASGFTPTDSKTLFGWFGHWGASGANKGPAYYSSPIQLGTYADSVYASASGYKYDAAVAFISSATPNAGLTPEAFYRGTTVGTLAAKIKTNHEAYITKEAKITGLRGLYSDRIDGILAGIDTSTVAKALESYAGIHTAEKVGTRSTGIGTETEDVNAGFYNPYGLTDRYEFS